MNNNFEIKPTIKSFSEDKLNTNDINKKDNNLPIPIKPLEQFKQNRKIPI